MARIVLEIDDMTNRLTLKIMLEAAAHRVVAADDDQADCVIADTPARALALRGPRPVLVLATAAEIADAVEAMEQGVHGYIFVPFQPGEASLMVERALQERPRPPRRAEATRPPRAVSDEAPEDDGASPRTLAVVEREHILTTLRRCRNNRAKTARMLGIGRNTLWRKLQQYELTDQDGSP